MSCGDGHCWITDNESRICWDCGKKQERRWADRE